MSDTTVACSFRSVLVIEPNINQRTVLVSALQKLGVQAIDKVGSVEHAVSFLESENTPVDWIVTGLFPDNALNGLSLLGMIIKTPSLRSINVSFILRENERYAIPNAFEMGLFSCHDFSGEVNRVHEEFEKLVELNQKYKERRALTAAYYLRRELRKLKKYDDMLKLETALLSVYPAETENAINMAKAMSLQGRYDTALATLKRLVDDPKVGDLAKSAGEMICRENGLGNDYIAKPSMGEYLQLKHVLVVDPDISIRKHFEEILSEIGVENVQCFGDGKEAWDYAEKNREDLDLIVQEWRIPGLDGPVFSQRVRSVFRSPIPIIIFSSLVSDEGDQKLLRELCVLDVLNKPMSKEKVRDNIRKLLLSDMVPKTEQMFEMKIRRLIHAKDFAAAKQLFDQLAKTSVSEGCKKSLEAEFLFIGKKFHEASKMAVEALHVGGENIHLLNLLGKSYMKMRQFKQAEAFFEKANQLSPKNLERACHLAEVQAEAGDREKSAATLEAAKALDGTNQQVIEAQTKVALTTGDQKMAKELSEDVENMNTVIGFINNRAVALAAENSLDKAVALYKRGLKTLPVKEQRLRSIINYNMALTHAKCGETNEAYRLLNDVLRIKDSPVYLKAKSLFLRAEEAIKSGKPLQLNTGSSEADSEVEDIIYSGYSLPIVSGIKRGELCCHLLYQDSEGVNTKVEQLAATIPKFIRRGVLNWNDVKKEGEEKDGKPKEAA